MNTDLFPETLLVSRSGDRIYTTSLKVAEFFNKAHRNVVRSIERLLEELPAEAFDVLNFERVEYKDRKGETRFMFHLSHDAFAILAMGFTGREALAWKVKFLAAFRAQERALAQLTARYAHVVDVIRPSLRPTVEGTEAGLNRSAIAEQLGKRVGSVTYHRGQARRFGLLGSQS